jgi:hypothetical protein
MITLNGAIKVIATTVGDTGGNLVAHLRIGSRMDREH